MEGLGSVVQTQSGLQVKRLLRVDYEAVSVKWEVITEEELNVNKGGEAGQSNPDVKPSACGDFTNDPKELGLDLSDSEDEGRHKDDLDMESDENSRMSGGADDSRLSDSANTSKAGSSKVAGPTQFSKEMFKQEKTSKQDQVAEMRMQMMHLLSKRKDLEHNISNCPNEALKNRFRSELTTVNTEIKRLESSG